MPSCAVYGCCNYYQKTKGTSIKYYSFPKNEELLRKWTFACQREDKLRTENARICSIHFLPSCFITSLRHQLLNYSPKCSRNIKEDAVPTENLPDSIKTRIEQLSENRQRHTGQGNYRKKMRGFLTDAENNFLCQDPDDVDQPGHAEETPINKENLAAQIFCKNVAAGTSLMNSTSLISPKAFTTAEVVTN